jgi:hypothetical protein
MVHFSAASGCVLIVMSAVRFPVVAIRAPNGKTVVIADEGILSPVLLQTRLRFVDIRSGACS